jgi:hypothetical protein
MAGLYWKAGRHLIPVDIPLEWVPLARVRDELRRAYLYYNGVCASGEELVDESVVLAAWWKGDLVQIRTRRGSPGAEPVLLAYAKSERQASFFDLDHARFAHPKSRPPEIHFDVQVRLHPSAAAATGLAKPIPAVPERGANLKPSPTERRAELMYSFWETHEFAESWTCSIAFGKIHDDPRYTSSPLLNCSSETEKKVWTRVRQMRDQRR